MASKFFGGDSSESEVEEAVEEVAVAAPVSKGKYIVAFDSESESEEEDRVVRSAKDRTWENIFERVVKIRSAMKISDWGTIHDEFDEVNNQIKKAKMLILQHGYPTFYIKMLAEVEDFVNVTLKDKEAQAKMKPGILRILNRMKIRVRQHNKSYEDEIAKYRENPDAFKDPESLGSKKPSKAAPSDSESEDSDSDSSESESDSDSSDSESGSGSSGSGSGSESDSVFGGGSDSDSSSSDDEDTTMQLPGRAKWLKKVVDTSAKEERDKRRDEKRKRLAISNSANADMDEEAEARRVAALKAARVEETITEEIFDKKMAELLSSRGRKGTDTRAMLRQLEVLARVSSSFGFRKEVSALMFYVSTLYDASNTTIDTYLDLQRWRTAYRCISRVVQILNGHKNTLYELAPLVDVVDVVASKSADLMKVEEEEEDAVPKNPNVLAVVGNLEAFVIKLEEEYIKSLQQTNPHTVEYVTRLSDEAHLIDLIEAVRLYYLRANKVDATAVMALMQVEHMYYKPNSTALAIMRNKLFGRTSDLHPASRGCAAPAAKADWSRVHPASVSGDPSLRSVSFDPSQQIEDLCSFIYIHGSDRARTRALLCSVYHKSLHDHYYQARDLFLMSHIQDTVDKADTKTQILYNRTLVTLGLSAFRMGLIKQAHDCLAGICSGRVKELLAQGQPRWHDKDPEQEKAERRRQIPYHMHINQDLLDCCHLICAMFLELPHLARPQVQSHVISRSFRKYLNIYSNQVFTGPPENTREHVLASAKALLIGDWSKACKYLLGLEVWNLIPNDGGSNVKAMLKVKLQEEALKLYLISYANQYESISVATLCEMFALEERSIRRTVSKMIFSKQISAAWDQGSATLVMYRVDASALQNSVLHVAEKLTYLIESNERILDPLAGVYGYKDDWVRGGDNRRNDRARPEGDHGGRGGRGQGRGAGRGRDSGRGRGDQGRGGRGGRGGPSSGRGGRGAPRNTQSGDGQQRNVWGQQNATNPKDDSAAASVGSAYNAISSGSSMNRRPNTGRGQYGNNSSSNYNKVSSMNKDQNLSRPTITSFGGTDVRKPPGSWTGNN